MMERNNFNGAGKKIEKNLKKAATLDETLPPYETKLGAEGDESTKIENPL